MYSFWVRKRESVLLIHKLIGGILFGGIAIGGMLMPFNYTPGIIYDGRSIVMTLAGVFGGGTVVLISAIFAASYRLYLDGPGVYAGVATIAITALVGLFFRRRFNNKPETIGIPAFLCMGLLSSAAMLLCQLLLPWPTGLSVIKNIWLPVGAIFPIATTVMGLLMKNETLRILGEAAIRESEIRYRTTLHSIGDAVITTDKSGEITYLNPIAEQLTGYTEQEASGRPIEEIFQIIQEESRQKSESPVKKVLREGIICGLANHTLLINKQGQEIPIADSGAPIKNTNGDIDGVVLVFRDQTAERLLHRQVQESRERFKRAVNSVPDMITIYNLDLKIQFVNESLLSKNGKTIQEMIGHSPEEFWNAPEFEKYLELLQKARQTGMPQKLDVCIRQNQQTPTYLDISFIPLSSGDGNIHEIMAIAHDYTNDKLAEEELQEKERLFHNLAENSPVGISQTRADGYTTYVNPSWKRLSGMSYDQAIGYGWMKALHPDDKLDVKKSWDKATGNSEKSVAEYRFLKPDGSITWVLGEAVPEITTSGEVIGYIGTITDITSRKETEAALLQVTENFKATMDESPLGMRIVSPEGKTLYVNEALLAIYGYTGLEEFLNTPDEKRFTPESLEQHKIRREKRKKGESVPAEYETEIVNKAGDIRCVQVFRKMINWNGEKHFLAIYQDITEKKKIIAELRLAKEEAEESDRLKSAFLANMSHEIRTPLNAILGFTNILSMEEDTTSELRAEYANIINRSAESLLHIINDILDVSKLETGQLKIYKSKTCIDPLLDELHTIFRKKLDELGKEHIELKLLRPGNPVYLNTDKVRLNQVLMNLLSNSIKFTETGAIEFGISEISDHKIWFFVADTGIGISPQSQTKIFERFRQAEESLSRVYGGTGLGLSIAKNLVELMEGKIMLESEVGKGSRFSFYLPLN